MAYLKNHVDVFKDMQPAEQRAAAEIAEPVMVPAGKFIYEQGVDFSGTLYVICKGIVQLSRKNSELGEYPKILGSGETFGNVPG